MSFLIDKKLLVNNAVEGFCAHTKGFENFIDTEDTDLKVFLSEIRNNALKHKKREIFISDLSISPIFFYRVYNGKNLWDIRDESFNQFLSSGPIKIWQENSMYPKPGDVRRWLEKFI